MIKNFAKSLFCFAILTLLGYTAGFAQTITLGNIDPGPYAPGSTIAVPITVSGNCVSTKTTYSLYLSNAGGIFTSPTPIGTFSNFYALFVNGVIPAGTPAGTGYVVKVISNNPTVTSNISAPFSIVAGTGVTAGVTGQSISTVTPNPYPNVFGNCDGTNNTNFFFTDASTAGSTATANFFNELSQQSEGTMTLTAAGNSFTAQAAHYLIFVKAVNAGIVGTEAYLLINNIVNTSFEVNNSSTICLPKGGAASLTYGVDTNGIKKNFPGLIYTIKWGDGSSSSLTVCDIKNSNYSITHAYTTSSCGNSNSSGTANAFEVDIQLSSVYCGNVGTPVTTYANILTAPSNSFTKPVAACTNTAVTFVNTSDPGQSPNASTIGCVNRNALYNWFVDGLIAKQGIPLSQDFVYTFATPGTHTVRLSLANPITQTCTPADTTQTICIQNPPQPQFTLPVTTGCAPFTLTPVNQSVIDSNCNNSNKYIWIVNGPAAVTYANNTNANSRQPQFIFQAPGVYTISLEITTASCGAFTTAQQTVGIDAPINIAMSPDITICGTNQVQTFGPGGGLTQTTITGIGQQQANTYTWTVSGGPYNFTGGTNQNSQYPQINFTGYGTYKVSVTVKSNCGTVSKTQNITFQQVPIITITPSATNICPGGTVTLTASITGTYNSFQWLGGGGATGFSPANALTTTYTPTAAEVQAGSATITIDVETKLTGACAEVQQSVTINIYPVNTVTSPATLLVCSGNAAGYNITSTAPGSTFSWTATGNASGFKSGGGTTINDVLTNTSNGNEQVVYTITPQANGCTGTPFQLTVTVEPLPAATAKASNATICSGSPANISLNSNLAATGYTWTVTAQGGITGYSQQPAAIITTSINDVLVNNGTASGTVTYNITPYDGTCPGIPVTVTVTVEPVPVIANAGPNAEVCNLKSYTLSGNSPAPGTGLWTVSPAGPVFNDATRPNATATNLAPGTTYTFTWTITPPAPCLPNSGTVTVIDDLPSVGGTTSGATSVCATGSSGTIKLAGQMGNILMWQSSTDNFNSVFNNINDTADSLAYNNLAATTQYRAVVQNGVCSTQYSTVTTITVNPPPITAIPGNDQNLCGVTATTLNGNDPSPFTGVWQQTSGPASAVISSPNSPQTQVTGLIPGNDYTFTWTVKGQPPCTDNSASMTVHDAIDVIGSFTASPTVGCGDLTVQFTNTSTSLTGTSFLWEFGDDSLSTAVNPSHVFKARTDGLDTTYTVSLNVVNNCFQRAPVTATITVRPQTPVAYISPQQLTGCAPFTLTVSNLSPGNNLKYTYYLVNNSTGQKDSVIKTDKSLVTFPAINATVSTQFTLYMVATGYCNNNGQSAIIPITVSPSSVNSQMFIENNASTGCVPFTTTFVNNSIGGDTYTYNIYGPNNDTLRFPAGTAPFPYTFTTPGKYEVSITTVNSCTNLESAPIGVNVYPVPQPQFTADTTKGCTTLSVTFTNQTPDLPTLPATSMTYVWTFGNGSTYVGYAPPPEVFKSAGSPFTVAMTATNPVTNCSATVTKTDLISVLTPPATAFTEQPDSVVKIPDYTFSFIDQTTNGPISWLWNFGDNGTSASKDPEHTYADTGIYKVTLTTQNSNGCDSTISHYVRVTGVPGQLFLPNAFEPDGPTVELRTFMAKGSGIKEWKMQVFNNYSQLIWETTKLDEKGAPVEGWDGTFNGKPMPQGVYIWQISATFINGTEWKGNVIENSLPKRVGTIHLIR